MKRIQILGLTVAALALLAPMAAKAQTQAGYGNPYSSGPTRSGWYVGAGVMPVFQTDADSSLNNTTDIVKYHTGWGVSASGGYAWGGGVRTEAEIAFRTNTIDGISGTGSNGLTTGDQGGTTHNTSFMGNVLYDFNTGSIWTPYVGVGIGTSIVDANNIHYVNYGTLDSQRMQFAYQAIAGVSAWLDNNWALTADYRYFRTTDPHFKTDLGYRADTENASHNILLGVRYTFDEDHAVPPPPPAPPAPVQAMPVPVPPPAQAAAPMVPPVPQSYMVFFDFDRSVLTPEAKRIVAAAAQDFQRGRYVRIIITGHTDTMGSMRYNIKLSQRRASAVKGEFARLGVPSDEVQTVAAGKTGLLVPTNDQVREAQNRRAEIVFNR